MLERIETWEETANEYSNYKAPTVKPNRPNSVSSTSRLLRPTYSSRIKEEPGNEDGSETETDEVDQIKAQIEKLEL